MKYLPFLLLFFSLSANAQTWGLIWQDEFNYNGLPDESFWSYDVGGSGWGNEELQYYTNQRLENSRVEGGNLIIEARKESYESNSYTSARLVTRNKVDWKYGKVEVRAKLPQGRGIWPAIWMMPTETKYGNWPASGEMDIMEYVGFDPGIVHFNIHTQEYNHRIGTNKGASTPLNSPENNFYTYSLEWFPDSLVFKVDGVKYFKFLKESSDFAVWPFNEHFHLILNTAVGGSWAGSQGIDENIFPQQFLIDYVKLYKFQEDDGPYTLTSKAIGHGEVTVSPTLNSYLDSTLLTVTATPLPGYRFVKWSGDLIGTDNPLTFPIRSNLSLTAEFMDETERVINGGFTGGLAPWSVNMNGNSISTDDDALCYTISKPQTNPWDVNLEQTGILLKKGKQYLLSFEASSSTPRTIRAGAGMTVSPWSTYLYQTVSLTSQTQSYSYTFDMTGATDINSRVLFDVGGESGDLCIDNVSIKEVGVSGSIDKLKKCTVREEDPNLFYASCLNYQIKQIIVISSDGRELSKITGEGNEIAELKQVLIPGLYLFHIFLENSEVVVEKFLKN